MYLTKTYPLIRIKPKNRIALTRELNRPKYSEVVASKKENKKITKNNKSPRII